MSALIPPLLPPINKAGLPFLFIAIALGVVLSYISLYFFWPSVIIIVWVAWFFRDPLRAVPSDANLIIAPADGQIVIIDLALPPPELGLGRKLPFQRICIFMNIFDVHINRMPVSGKIEKRVYKAGKFLNASLDKASDQNERMSYIIRTPDDKRLVVVQIAGLVARRIIAYAQMGEKLAVGNRFGMIRFGSRVDLYFPQSYDVQVSLGQRMRAGETILASKSSGQIGKRQASQLI